MENETHLMILQMFNTIQILEEGSGELAVAPGKAGEGLESDNWDEIPRI